MYEMWAVHCLSALDSWAHLCVFFMLGARMTTGLSRGLLGLQYDQINESESESEP